MWRRKVAVAPWIGRAFFFGVHRASSVAGDEKRPYSNGTRPGKPTKISIENDHL